MLYNQYTPYSGGIHTVSIMNQVSIPDSVDFQFHNATINVNFWLVQTIRRGIPMRYSEVDNLESEQKIVFIKALRLAFSLGLKEAKEIAEWFMANVDRNLEGKL